MANKNTKRARPARDGYKHKTGKAVSSSRALGKDSYNAPTQRVHPVSKLSRDQLKDGGFDTV